MADSPASESGRRAEQEKRVAFKFCSECSNILYPKEDAQNATLMFECRTCRWSTTADTSCIYRNELTNTIGATAGVTQDVAYDPTVGNPSPSNGHHGQDAQMTEAPSLMAVDEYEAHAVPSIPDMCMLCGNEIFCDICGEESYGGGHVLVDEYGGITGVHVRTSADGNVGAFVFHNEPSSPPLTPQHDPMSSDS